MLAPLLAFSALSGAVLLWTQPPPAAAHGPADVATWAAALDPGLAELQRRHPGAEADIVDLPRTAGEPIRVHLRAAAPGWTAIDPATGRVLPLQPDARDARGWVLRLHKQLGVEGAGPWVLRVAALGGLVLLVLGVRIWWRVRRLAPRSGLRRWHRAIGPLALLPLGVMLATGFVLVTPELPQAVLPSAGPGVPVATAGGPPLPPGQLLQAAAAALPQARPIRLYAARDGVVRVRLRVDEWNPYGLHHVYVNAADGRVLRVVLARDQPASLRYLDVVYPLHAAWLPGAAGSGLTAAMRLLWTVFALSLVALAATGAAQRLLTRAAGRT